MSKIKKQKIFIIAGEASGDFIGSKLITAISALNSDIEFKGVGGDKMINAGLINTFPMNDIAVMGYLEILPAIPRILSRIKQTVRHIIEYKPDLIITIDSPGFNFRVVNKIRALLGKSVKIIHYVAPSVWAYKPERVIKVAALYDHLLMILPIEKSYFDAHIPCTYVGHPIIENDLRSAVSNEELRKKLKISKNERLITLMPGSRAGEIKRHLPIFAKAIELLSRKHNIKCFIPTLKPVEKLIKDISYKFIFSSDADIKKNYISASDLALVKSGTSSVEMLSYKVPTIVGYKMNALTYHYLKNKIKVKYASLANIIMDRVIIPEFIQKDCTAENLANALDKFLCDKKVPQKQLEEFEKAAKILGGDANESPSQIAAGVVLSYLK